MYDISQTTKVLAHEIAHHAGLGLDPRRKRAEAYMKCILASKICMCIDSHIYRTVSEDKCDDLFSCFIDVIMKCLKNREFDINLHLNLSKTESEYIYGEHIPCYFYSDCFIQEYEEFLTKQLFDDTFWECISDQMDKSKMPWEKFDKYFAPANSDEFSDKNKSLLSENFEEKLSHAYLTRSKAFIKKYAIKRFVENFRIRVQDAYNKPENNFGFGFNPNQMIQYVFREGTADLQMLTLIAPKNSQAVDLDNLYNNMFSKLQGRYEYEKNDDGLRRVAVRSCYKNKNTFDEFQRNQSGDMNNALLFYRYLHNNLVDYFKSIPALETFIKKGEMPNSFDYEAIVSPFNDTNDSISDAVKVIDDIITEYRDGLL